MSDTLDKKHMLECIELKSRGWKAVRAQAQREAESAQEIIEVLDHLKDLVEGGRFDTEGPAEQKYSMITTALHRGSLLDDLMDNRDNPSDIISLERRAGINMAIEKIVSGRYDLNNLYQKEPAE